MSNLTSVLERILDLIEEYEYEGYNFLPTNSPYYQEQSDFLQPGLRALETEVQLILKALPFHLPQELLELYSWANGTHKWGCYAFIGDEVFYSLQEASQTYHRIYSNAVKEAKRYKLDTSESWWKRHWFPIFIRDDQDYFTLGGNEPTKKAPIFLYDYRDGVNAYNKR
ncbi:SMI1/KNR4 family protein [Nostoc sp. CENA67]|uniref:SMI1/KNR4 family protein n=1 Tax=Amazonocrinis nigriterrae CENA67 TaxID=2794033 RepID=A0A8J7HW02_9NOST|nr:SMI1/KNR4 family protein [Amazonocrinis nigriterrae]MBH8563634.1 SMI1/KNR4 family protein [Amazonocrinis nigriterrae CENA67]